MSNIPHTKACFSRHMGLAMCEHSAAQSTLAFIHAGVLPMRSYEELEDAVEAIREPDYQLGADGIAIITICGIMQKGESKFGGFCSTLKVRNSIAAAKNDPLVKGIMLYFDTPGGYVDGTYELAEAVAGCDKPVRGYAADNCFSAGYYVAARCEKLSINAPGAVGSIGVYSVLYDTSKAMEMDGVKAILISTGKLKGALANGVAVTDEVIAQYQGDIDRANEFFIQSVSAGRNMDPDKVKELATGAIFGSAAALELGMIDAVESFEDALASFADDLTIEDNKTTPTQGAIEMPDNDIPSPDVAPVCALAPEVSTPEAAAVAIPEPVNPDAGKLAELQVRLAAIVAENTELKAQVSVGAAPIPVAVSAPQSSKPMYVNGKLNRSL